MEMIKNKKLTPKFLLISGCVLGLFLNGAQNSFGGEEASVHSFRLGTEISYITYEEPGIMEETGVMYGILADYTWHSDRQFLVRVDGKLSYGQVDYDSSGTGSVDNINDYMAEVRVVGGFDFEVLKGSTATPYAGVGYRYLRDELGGRTSTTGALGYDRESNYFYIPVGIEVRKSLQGAWSVGFNAEYDVFIRGFQRSHLGDAVAGLDTLENEQDQGYGIRGSIKITKAAERVSFFAEPFIRYWNIGQSDTKDVTFNGTPIGVVGYEPKNNSTEYGIKLGMNF